jgi:hypothetical protein
MLIGSLHGGCSSIRASTVVGKQHQSTFLGLANLQPCCDLIDLCEVIQTLNLS